MREARYSPYLMEAIRRCVSSHVSPNLVCQFPAIITVSSLYIVL
jgi:hypothetical protein